MQLLANLGFLFTDLPLGDRIRAAHQAGCDGVEFHDQVQQDDPAAIGALIRDLGLTVGSLGLRMANTTGCAALDGHEAQFLDDLRAAHDAAVAVGARGLHVVAGRGTGSMATYQANLARALDMTALPLWIEPISPRAMPDYFLNSLDMALRVQDALDNPRVQILFDWFHICAERGPEGAAQALERYRDRIGHVQIASFPARAEPAPQILDLMAQAGFDLVSLEYHPTGSVADCVAQLRGHGPESAISV